MSWKSITTANMGRVPTTDRSDVIAFAPGRVNLIGEHTDYNDGLALPFGISAGVRVTARPGREAGICVARALDVDESDSFPMIGPQRADGWRAFVRGVVAELTAAGVALPAAELEITGDVPRGAGLSSSAALEVALALALIGLARADPLYDIALAKLCSRVEHSWVGAQSGLLDQLASICAIPAHALLIDFRTLVLTPVPLRLAGYRLVSVHSGQPHSLGESGYNDRREECRQACAQLGLTSLRDATLEAAESLPAPLDRRVRHLVTENARVLDAVKALRTGELDDLGELLNASHASLRDDFQVSTDAVERTVTALREAGAIGARIVGGGFGGSVLGLLPPGLPAPDGALVLEAGGGARLLGGDVP
jgi:galactokinase